jgi:hypothetical protein
MIKASKVQNGEVETIEGPGLTEENLSLKIFQVTQKAVIAHRLLRSLSVVSV